MGVNNLAFRKENIYPLFNKKTFNKSPVKSEIKFIIVSIADWMKKS